MTASGHRPEAFATPFGSPLEGRVILSVVDAWELVWIHNWGRLDSQPGSVLTESNSPRRRRGPAPHRPILIDHGCADRRCTDRGIHTEWSRSAAAVPIVELVRLSACAAGQHPAYPGVAVYLRLGVGKSLQHLLHYKTSVRGVTKGTVMHTRRQTQVQIQIRDRCRAY